MPRLPRIPVRFPGRRTGPVIERVPDLNPDVLERVIDALPEEPRYFPGEPEPDSLTRFAVVRPEDLLVARIELRGLEPQDDPRELKAGGSATIVLTLPPQHVAEEAFWELVKGFPDPGGQFELKPPPVQARLAGLSRIAFAVPEGETIPFSLEGILAALTRLNLRLPAAAAHLHMPRVAEDLGVKLLLGPQVEVARPSDLDVMGVLASARRTALVTTSSSAIPFIDVAKNVDIRLPSADGPAPAQPDPDETAIEAPYRLVIAPTRGSSWAHAPAPVPSKAGAVELWTTRLQSASGRDATPTVRAVWARDGIDPGDQAAEPTGTNPFEMSLGPRDRADIVHLSGNWAISQRPTPVDARALNLSALGATLDLRGYWEERPAGLSLESWTHRAAMGRDNYVRVVRAGYLMPFGNRAVCTVITERKLNDADGGPIAYLRKRIFIVVREPLKLLGRSGFSRDGVSYDRLSPFSAVRMVTMTTPSLDPPTVELVAERGERAFWPHMGGDPFRFSMVGIDLDGREVPFAMPLAFVAEDVEQSADFDGISARYDSADAGWRTAALTGSTVAFAPSASPDDTSFDVDSVRFGVAVSDEGKGKPPQDRRDGADPRFVPALQTARVKVPALAPLTDSAPALDVSYFDDYLREGLSDARAGAEVFLALAEKQALRFDAQADRVGAFVTPNFEVSGLSRRLGPVGGDLAKLGGGKLDTEFFKNLFESLGAKLFGTINLWDILGELDIEEALPTFVGQALDAAERFILTLERLQREVEAAQVEAAGLVAKAQEMLEAVTAALSGDPAEELDKLADELKAELEKVGKSLQAEAEGAVGAAQRKLRQRIAEAEKVLEGAAILETLRSLAGGAQLPKAIHTKLEWRPQLQQWPPGKDQGIFVPNDPRGLALVAEVTAAPDGRSEPDASVRCTLQNFTLDLVPQVISVLKLHFERFEFSVEPGQKPDVDVVLRDVEFSGPLSFVETLREAIPLDAFSDPPDLTVDERGVTASMSAGLPTLAVGIFSLQNLTIGAACHVPFVGKDPLSVRFDFSEAKSPAVLTVGPFGGGAYFGIELGPQGIVAVRAAFEFGAGLAMSFGGVASGSVLVRAGIYFEIVEGKVGLTGYFRVRGELEVLGIVSVSVELRLELTYKDPGKCYGRATLTIEIEIAWFSVSVELEAERTFAGGNADPTFLELMTDPEDGDYDPWTDYCEAFA